MMINQHAKKNNTRFLSPFYTHTHTQSIHRREKSVELGGKKKKNLKKIRNSRCEGCRRTCGYVVKSRLVGWGVARLAKWLPNGSHSKSLFSWEDGTVVGDLFFFCFVSSLYSSFSLPTRILF